jgi:iron complex outermembrane receptor protein
MKHHHSIRAAVRMALTAGLAVSVGIPAMASAANAQSPAKLGKINVTGTRIKRAAIEKAQPILRIDRQQIQQSGLVSIGDLLQRLTSAGGATNRATLENSGMTHIDLRYLGSDRVLVLINGHRLTLGGGDYGGLTESADLSVIPTSIVDHIEVLKDGASAVYGSDAIAGVVNIITRKNFNGAEASAYVGGYENHHFDGLRQQYSATLGHSWDRGNVTVNLGYQQLDGVKAKSREFSTPGIPGTGKRFIAGSSEGVGLAGRYEFTDPAGNYQSLTLKKPYGSTHPTPNDLQPFSDKTRQTIGFRPDTPLTPQNRLNAYFQGHYDLTDHITFSSTLIYSDRAAHQPLRQNFILITPGFYPSTGRQPVILSADNPFDPFNYDLVASNNPDQNNVTQLFKFIPGTQFYAAEDTRLLQYIGGFSGDFKLADRVFNWDASFVYGNTDDTRNEINNFNTEHLRRALGSPSQCGPGTVHPNCLPFNIFGRNTKAANDYIFPKVLDLTVNNERIYNANLSSADLVDLPAGPLGFALGYQHREQDGKFIPNSLLSSGLGYAPKKLPTNGRFDVNAVYGELNVPILANLPGAKALSVDGQARHSDYSSFGGNTSERFGLRYQPVNDLLIRATWATGFRAPGINDLYSGVSGGFAVVNDPCLHQNYVKEPALVQQRCAAAGVPPGGYQQSIQVRTLSGGNPNLQPETSISRTAGFVYSPGFLPGFNINADYYKIEVNNALITLAGQDVFNACYVGGNQKFCNAITRNAAGSPTQVRNLPRNVSRFNTNGFDIGIHYKFPSTSIGDFTLQAHETHVILFNETTPNFNGNGGFSTQGSVNEEPPGGFPTGLPANKANLDLNWDYGNWSAHYHVDFIEGITGLCTGGTSTHSYNSAGLCSIPAISHVDAKTRRRDQFYHDVQVSYDFTPIHTTLAVGVNNLFDRKPPELLNDFTLDRFPGRFLYGRITTRF